VGKNKFHLFWSPPGKNLEKSPGGSPLEKILPRPMQQVTIVFAPSPKYQAVVALPR